MLKGAWPVSRFRGPSDRETLGVNADPDLEGMNQGREKGKCQRE